MINYQTERKNSYDFTICNAIEEGTKKAEHIEDGVTSVTITENEIKVYYEDKRGVKNSTTFLKDCSQIYNMWLLSDTFKTLKRLIQLIFLDRKAVNNMRMTEKQKRFCDFYIETGNATQAAIKAGYSEKTARKTGSENLTKPDIKQYIDERLAELKNERTADAQEVLEYLTAVMRGEYKEATLIGVGEGAQAVVDIDVGAKDRLKAAELLGKRHALFTDKVDLQTGDIVIKVGEWDADEET